MNESNASSTNENAQLKTRTAKQVAVLSAPKRVPAEFEPGKGVRRDRVFPLDTQYQRSNAQLCNAVELMYLRRGKDMTRNDAGLLSELAERTFGVHDLRNVSACILPSWLTDVLPPRKFGFAKFVAMIVMAYRAGSCGLWLSYSEGMGLCSVGSERTWREWTKTLEDMGFLRIVQTWTDDPSGLHTRVHGRLWYRLGPVLEEHAAALCDGAAGLQGSDKSSLARLAANEQRRAYSERAMARVLGIQHRREPHNDARRKTKRAAGVVFVAPEPEPESEPEQTFDDKRICNGGYVAAADLAQENCTAVQFSGVDEALLLKHCTLYNAPPRKLGVNSGEQTQTKKVSTAQRSTPRRRAAPPAAQRVPPAAKRVLVLDECLRRIRSGRRLVDESVNDMDSDNEPVSSAHGAIAKPWSSVGEDARREVREMLLRNRAPAQTIVQVLGLTHDEARKLVAEHASKSVILDKPETCETPPDSPRGAKLSLPDDVLRDLARLSGKKVE